MPSTFGDQLRLHRRAAGLTQEELAERSHLSVDAVATLERGVRRAPRKDTVALLADALALAGSDRAAFLAAARRHAPPALADATDPGALPSHPAPPLPIQPTPLLGREREVAHLCTVLRQDQVRLLTLTGPGGVGKTRLGLQVAAELAASYPDGVWFVRLARLADLALVVPTIAQTLGLREAGSQPIVEVLRTYLRPRSLLLLLDNFEHVVGAAPDVAALLASSPGLRVLVTSRMSLHLYGEREYPLAPLRLPNPSHLPAPERLMQFAAVALFIERAREALPDFAVTAANAPAIAEICARLDGLPLAIELAATRVKVLPPEALLARLSSQLKLLTGGPRDMEERQQTMRATIAWSAGLLDPTLCALFRRLAVFVGGCTLEAAEAVCLTPEGAKPLGLDLLDALAVLIDHSLVQRREEGGEPRYSMLYVVREFALERLETSEGDNEAEALRRAHAAYYVDLAERQWMAESAAVVEDHDTGQEAAPVERLKREQENVRAALAWLRTQAEVARQTGGKGRVGSGRAAVRWRGEAPGVQGLRLAGALLWHWAYHGLLGEGHAWLEAFLDLDAAVPDGGDDRTKQGDVASSVARHGRRTARSADETFVRGRALYAMGVLAYWRGDSAQAVPPLERSLAIAQALGDRQSAAFALNNLGMALKDQGDLARARACYEQCLTLGRALGAPILIGMPLANLSSLALAAGDLEQAGTYSEEALAIDHHIHNYTSAAVDLTVQALTAWKRGQLDQAATLAEEALVLHRAAKDERHYGDGLEACAIIFASQGRAERAARLLGAAASSRERIGMRRPMDMPTIADVEAAAAVARAALGEEAWQAAYTAGRALSLEEAVAEALGAGEEAAYA